jgi:hypothetical protein
MAWEFLKASLDRISGVLQFKKNLNPFFFDVGGRDKPY